MRFLKSLFKEKNRASHNNRPKILEIQPLIERPHRKYDGAVFARSDMNILSVKLSEKLDIKILTIEIQNYTITSIYKHVYIYINM